MLHRVVRLLFISIMFAIFDLVYHMKLQFVVFIVQCFWHTCACCVNVCSGIIIGSSTPSSSVWHSKIPKVVKFLRLTHYSNGGGS